MEPLTRTDLLSLEDYSEQRDEWRRRVMAHKKNRIIQLGAHARLYFEDRLTMQYQVQEMLRTERIFDTAAINEELEVYNALIPSGTNLKATLMLEYEVVEQRRAELARLVGIEDALWARVADGTPITPVANEDLERSTEDKTASVHFLRFELTAKDITNLKAGAILAFGIDHPNYQATVSPVPEPVYQSLISDLD